MALKDDISRYMDAGFPILYINTYEEADAEGLVRQVADRRKIYYISVAGGYGCFDTGNNVWNVPPTREFGSPGSALDFLIGDIQSLERSILMIKDAHIVFEDTNSVSAIKELAVKIGSGELECCVICISPKVSVPLELEKYITILETDYLEYDEIKSIVERFAHKYGVSITESLTEEMAMAFKGLSATEIDNLLALAVADDGELTRGDLKLIFDQKKQMILKSGILEMIPLKESIDDIGGLEILKDWLKQKAKVIKNINGAKAFGVDMPKGVLIAGVPGCGKSLSAKAAAKLFEVPLLRLDIGKLMGKYLGESEANFRKAIKLAEAISPCVLWVDELEKAFAGIGSEGGHEVTSRLFGSFLTWMQEKTGTAFVVATANDITKLPPELLRKGRFDEIFYVGLPKDTERRKILEIHIGKRRPMDLPEIDIGKLVSSTKGYSGADIEGVVSEAVEMAFAGDRDKLSTDDIVEAINGTNSISEIMGENLDKMKDEYKKRRLKSASKEKGGY